ncbi:ABC transporter-like protein [Gracilaria domingensis]|nr:ABC transporter-like protein [Gracilaria domingensis]
MNTGYCAFQRYVALFILLVINDTIAYNIRYGRPSATDEEVIAAAKAASIHDVIMRTPQGYETIVGERGVRFSGGERQRLSVARAFLKGSQIIIEDESTSALDTMTETEVSNALQKLGMNRTRIIVAHRLSTIMNVDHIVVMREGQKVEEGSFADLVEKERGVFREMWERQQKKEKEDDLLDDHEDVYRRNGSFYNGERGRREHGGDLLHGEVPPRG